MIQTVYSIIIIIILSVNSVFSTCPQGCQCLRNEIGPKIICHATNQLSNSTIFDRETTELEIYDSLNIGNDQLRQAIHNLHKLQVLVLSKTAITKISKHFFVGLVALQKLYILKAFTVEHIEVDAFTTLHKLKVFHISECTLVPFEELKTAFNKIPTKILQVYAVDKVGIRSNDDRPIVDKTFFNIFKQTKLNTIIQRNNLIATINPGFKAYIENVTCCIFSGNLITRTWTALFETLTMENLRIYDVSYQGGSTNTIDVTPVEHTCIEPLPAETEVIDLDPAIEREIDALQDKLCDFVYGLGPNLRYVYIHNLHIGFIRQPFTTHCFEVNNKIRYLDAYDNSLDYKTPSIGLLRLQYYNIQRNMLTSLPYHTFAHYPSLMYLLMGGNKLQSWFKRPNATLPLQNLHKLISLDLSTNGISDITQDDLKYLMSVKMMNLSGNDLKPKTFDVELTMQFTFLNLSGNKLIYLPEKFRKSLKTNKNQFQIDFSNNPLICDCEYVEFYAWFKENKKVFTKRSSYFCAKNHVQIYLSDKALKNIIRDCSKKTNNTVYFAVIGVLASLIFLLALILINVYLNLWKKLQHIHFWISINVKRLYYNFTYGYNLVGVDEYEATIVFGDDDYVFARQTVHAELCTRRKCKIYFPELRPGLRTEVVLDPLQKSTCCLVILSNKFVQDPLFDYTITHVLILRKRIIVINREDIKIQPGCILYLKRSNEVKEFNAENPTNKLWDKLQKEILQQENGLDV